jgi:hypothetical protein
MAFPLVFRIADDPERQIIKSSPDQQPVVPRIGETVTARFYRDEKPYRVVSVEHVLGERGESSTVIIRVAPISN